MQDVMLAAEHWLSSGEKLALAVVIETWGSAPRRPGSHMVIASNGEFAGSVSGGCVEAEIIQEALDSIHSGEALLLSFEISDETAGAVGLACGGKMKVFVAPFPEYLWPELKSNFISNQPIAYEVTITADSTNESELGKFALLPVTLQVPERVQRGGLQVFYNPLLPPTELILIGGAHISQALAKLAVVMGYRVHVIEPRRAFSNISRFPSGIRVSSAWPQDVLNAEPLIREQALIALAHDPKIDDPALKIALESAYSPFYIGALGSRNTHAKRVERLITAGVTPDKISIIHAPAGIASLPTYLPEEIALSILVEVMAMRNS